MRGGLYKMRTSARSFQGLRDKGVELIAQAKKFRDFKFVSEVVDSESLEVLDPVTDIFQIGTRNMYNYELLKRVGQYQKPVILKRGMSATLNEWLEAAGYLGLAQEKIFLCERGIRNFEPSYRNVLDLTAVVYLKQNTDYQVLVDPSHAAGRSEMVIPLAKAAMACGADGLLIETHPEREKALSDGQQALSFEQAAQLIKELDLIGSSLGKRVVY